MRRPTKPLVVGMEFTEREEQVLHAVVRNRLARQQPLDHHLLYPCARLRVACGG